MELTRTEKAILKGLMSVRMGYPSELPERVRALNFALAEKLEQLEYDDLDRVFMEIVQEL